MSTRAQPAATLASTVLRPAHDRFHTELDWLDSRHTFAFGHHRDTRWQGFRGLRVINDDRVAAGAGFGRHGHRDMEILSWVTSGTLRHEDNLGNGSDIKQGDLQRMSAGTGVVHAELNPSDVDPVEFLQIWIEPDRSGQAPGYEQKHFDPELSRARWQLLASPDGDHGSLSLNADVRLSRANLASGESVKAEIARERAVWLHIVQGEIEVNGQHLSSGDGLGMQPGELKKLTITGRSHPDGKKAATRPSEVLLFDLD